MPIAIPSSKYLPDFSVSLEGLRSSNDLFKYVIAILPNDIALLIILLILVLSFKPLAKPNAAFLPDSSIFSCIPLTVSIASSLILNAAAFIASTCPFMPSAIATTCASPAALLACSASA